MKERITFVAQYEKLLKMEEQKKMQQPPSPPPPKFIPENYQKIYEEIWEYQKNNPQY